MYYTISPKTTDKPKVLGSNVYCCMVEDEGIVSSN